jgi:hypothetical protein
MCTGSDLIARVARARLPYVENLVSGDLLGPVARCERDRGDLDERGRIWKKTDFPTDDALRQCRMHLHEDLRRHIYLLLDILGLQFLWVLTRVGMAARSSSQKNALWTTKRSTPGWLCT